MVYIYLSEKLTPDFRTISDFRKDNPLLLKEVFRHTVRFARQEGMLDLSHLTTGGSKVKANASNKRVLTREKLEVLPRFMDGELEEWAKRDEIEDKEFGDLRGVNQLPHQNKKTIERAARYYIKKMKGQGEGFKAEEQERLQEARCVMDEEGLKRVSITDPESRFMKNKKGRIELSYNPQVTVDMGGFILANDLGQNAADVGQLPSHGASYSSFKNAVRIRAIQWLKRIRGLPFP